MEWIINLFLPLLDIRLVDLIIVCGKQKQSGSYSFSGCVQRSKRFS